MDVTDLSPNFTRVQKLEISTPVSILVASVSSSAAAICLNTKTNLLKFGRIYSLSLVRFMGMAEKDGLK